MKAYLNTLNAEEVMLLKYALQEKQANSVHIAEYGKNVFRECQGQRIRKRVRNTFSREEMGTCPQSVYGVRTGKHSVCVCRCWDNRF